MEKSMVSATMSDALAILFIDARALKD